MRLLGNALTFDDVLLVPAFSQVLPKDTSLATHFSRNIALNLPLVSAAMDTVTEARLAIAIAQEGGIGIVHKNLTAQQQAAEVAKVKRYESGVLRDPVVITPQHTVRQVMALSEQLGVSGFPVCEGGKVVGIVTGRDLRFETRYDAPVTEIMTPRERLVTVPEGTTPEQAKALLNKHKLERLLVINDDFVLKGLITVKDITKQTSFPLAARDSAGRLRVGAAVGVGEGTEERVPGPARPVSRLLRGALPALAALRFRWRRCLLLLDPLRATRPPALGLRISPSDRRSSNRPALPLRLPFAFAVG